MSELLEKMRRACIDPMFTVDESVIRVTNCEAAGTQVVPGGVEPTPVMYAQSPKIPGGGTIDSQAIEPGEKDPQTNTDVPGPVKEAGVTEWVKKNPAIALTGAALLLFLLTKKR